MRLKLAHELLDDDQGTPAEIARSLDELWWINRRLGGLSSWRRLLWLFLRDAAPLTRPITLLDVGAGSGQLAAANADWLRRRGLDVHVVALDRRLTHLGRGVAAVAADAFRLPFADASVDLVTCNLFLHHFHDRPGDPAASRLLAEMSRIAARAVLINDLERSWWPYLAIKAMGVRFSRITRYDGPCSVRQAYTRPELEQLAAGVFHLQPHAAFRFPRYRLGLILWRNGARRDDRENER